jgi:hypothetical protein
MIHRESGQLGRPLSNNYVLSGSRDLRTYELNTPDTINRDVNLELLLIIITHRITNLLWTPLCRHQQPDAKFPDRFHSFGSLVEKMHEHPNSYLHLPPVGFQHAAGFAESGSLTLEH